MFCSKCGKEIADDASYCVYCHAMTEKKAAVNPDDFSSFAHALIGFIIPLVGLVLYVGIRKDSPLKASSAGKGAFVRIMVDLTASIFLFALYGSLLSNAFNNII